MTAQPPMDEELFRYDSAPEPYQVAVDRLVADAGLTLDVLEQRTPTQIFQLAVEHYGAELPEYWRIWRDWHTSNEVPPMGDL
jgi:hypothetical protein